MGKEKTKAAPEATEELATVAPAGALAKPVVNEYGEDARAGVKEMPANEKKIPFLNLLQNNSPEVEEKTVKGAEAGMFFNSVTKELISGDTGLIIQPVHIERVFVEWGDRDKGDRQVYGRYLFTSEEVQDAIAANGGKVIASKEKPLKLGEHKLVDTRYLYANILSEDGQDVVGYFILGASGSKIKPMENFAGAIDQVRGAPPMWCVIARLTSFQDKQKTTGKVFKNIAFMPHVEGKTYFETKLPGLANPALLDWQENLYKRGRDFRAAIVGGKMQADFDTESFEKPEDESVSEKRAF